MTALPNGAAPQTFHRFTDLPAELRIAIWELSLPHRVHTFPLPSRKFDFLTQSWIQEKTHGAKAEKRPAIAHVCSEARAVALDSGSVKMIRLRLRHGTWEKPSRVWVDSEKDTVVINTGYASIEPYRSLNYNDLYGLLSNLSKRDMRIALDSSWALCFCIVFENQARRLYYDLVHGHTECDLVVLELQIDVTNDEAANIGLFEGEGPYDSVLVPIEDTCQMSRLFDAQVKFNTADWLRKWENFTQFRKPTNLVEFIQRSKKLADREMRNVQWGLDYLTGVKMGTQGGNVDELREQAARAAVIRAEHPKLRPVIMVSRGVEHSHRGQR